MIFAGLRTRLSRTSSERDPAPLPVAPLGAGTLLSRSFTGSKDTPVLAAGTGVSLFPREGRGQECPRSRWGSSGAPR